jgi:hypothetical protein
MAAGAVFALALAACENAGSRPISPPPTLASAAVQSSAPVQPPTPAQLPACSVERDAPDLAGAGAVDCGSAVYTGNETAIQRGRACILDALAHERPFFASVVGPSFDSHYVQGFVGRRVGDRYETLRMMSDTIAGVPAPPRWDATTCHPLEDLATKCGKGRAWEKTAELYRDCSSFVDHVRGGPERAVSERYGLSCSGKTPSDQCVGGVRTRAGAPDAHP